MLVKKIINALENLKKVIEKGKKKKKIKDDFIFRVRGSITFHSNSELCKICIR
jgi:hypothetical protein